MVSQKKIFFRRTILDIPILIFLLSQFLSTLLSIDTRTSLLGYYSRFHGGLASYISYSLLYWAYVSNMNKKTTRICIFTLFTSAFLVSIYGILEHFGIDKDLWIQDVQFRVFSTLGQPNWLAAWLVALIPLTWTFAITSSLSNKIKTSILFTLLSSIFFITLLFTRSRSGILGFVVGDALYWLIMSLFYYRQKLKVKKAFLILLTSNFTFIIISFFVGTPWTPTVSSLFKKGDSKAVNNVSGQTFAPALEVGGSSSEEIRKIVWKGAVNIWRHYPIFGSGVETFAFSYYKFRPVEHNLVSEWDFLYNKAHNEYLNFAATTGTVGLLSYLVLITFTLLEIFKLKFIKEKIKNNLNITAGNKESENLQERIGQLEIYFIQIALFAGYVTILVTNFFGFSVVPIALIFFLYPAMAVSIETTNDDNKQFSDISLKQSQKLVITFIVFIMLFTLYSIGKYWGADVAYARGKAYGDAGNYATAINSLQKAIKNSPHEAIFWSELATNQSLAVISLSGTGNDNFITSLVNNAVSNSQKAIDLSPANVNLKREQIKIYINLSPLNQSYLFKARDVLISAIEQAPTDAKLYYNLALVYLRTGDNKTAEEILKKTIDMKINYRDARYALALVLIDKKDYSGAKEQLQYILTMINPDDSLANEAMQEIK